jgi:hypothetical protein
VAGGKRPPPTFGASGGQRSIASCKEPSPHNALQRLRQGNARSLRRRRLVERIYRVAGLRGVIEFFEELLRHQLVDEIELDRRLLRYSRMDPGIVRALGADQMPLRPLRLVQGRK